MQPVIVHFSKGNNATKITLANHYNVTVKVTLHLWGIKTITTVYEFLSYCPKVSPHLCIRRSKWKCYNLISWVMNPNIKQLLKLLLCYCFYCLLLIVFSYNVHSSKQEQEKMLGSVTCAINNHGLLVKENKIQCTHQVLHEGSERVCICCPGWYL